MANKKYYEWVNTLPTASDAEISAGVVPIDTGAVSKKYTPVTQTNLSAKVDKVTGYSLTKNDLADILKTAYDSTVTWITTNGTNLLSHLSNTSNPHSVTKSQVGLGSSDDTSDATKQTAFLTAIRNGVNVAGDDLKKLYDLIISIGQLVGDFDASSGLFPTTGTGLSSAIDKGDYWHITVAGTLPSGLTPTQAVVAGDVLVARIAGATVGADFYIIQNTTAQATSSVLGIMKLYTDLTANNADGSVTQAAINTALALYAKLAVTQSFTKAQRVAQVALTSAASIDIDLSLSNEFTLTPASSFTLINPTNIASYVGQHFTIVITQANAGYLMSLGSYWKSSDGTAQTISTTVGAVNTMACHVDTSTQISFNLLKHGVA